MSKGAGEARTVSNVEPWETQIPYLQKGFERAEMMKQLKGDYLDPTSNPFITNLYNKLAGDVTSGVQSQFTSAGRLGSGANQAVLAEQLGNLGTQLYGQNYLAERGNMNNALMAAPQMAETDYNTNKLSRMKN